MFLSQLFKKSKDSSEEVSKTETLQEPQIKLAPVSALSPLPEPVVNDEPKKKVMEEIQIYVQSTPNPNAYKLITSKDVKTAGTATYEDADTADNELAKALLGVPGIEQIYFFDNVITATLNPTVPLTEIKERLFIIIREKLPLHDPNYKTEADVKKADYDNLPEELKRINEILDRTIRPGLQGDGGNIEILSYVDNQLSVRYQGACGSCPSSTMGTLQAINQILRDEFDPDIEVVPV